MENMGNISYFYVIDFMGRENYGVDSKDNNFLNEKYLIFVRNAFNVKIGHFDKQDNIIIEANRWIGFIWLEQVKSGIIFHNMKVLDNYEGFKIEIQGNMDKIYID